MLKNTLNIITILFYLLFLKGTVSPEAKYFYFATSLFLASLTFIINIITINKKRFAILSVYLYLIIVNELVAPYHTYYLTQVPLYFFIVAALYLLYRDSQANRDNLNKLI